MYFWVRLYGLYIYNIYIYVYIYNIYILYGHVLQLFWAPTLVLVHFVSCFGEAWNHRSLFYFLIITSVFARLNNKYRCILYVNPLF